MTTHEVECGALRDSSETPPLVGECGALSDSSAARIESDLPGRGHARDPSWRLLMGGWRLRRRRKAAAAAYVLLVGVGCVAFQVRGRTLPSLRNSLPDGDGGRSGGAARCRPQHTGTTIRASSLRRARSHSSPGEREDDALPEDTTTTTATSHNTHYGLEPASFRRRLWMCLPGLGLPVRRP